MKNKFFVGIPGFDIRKVMAFAGEISGQSLKTQEAYVLFINEIFAAEDGGEVVREGNISRQARGEVSFTTKKAIMPAAELTVRDDIDFTDCINRLKKYFSTIIDSETVLVNTEGCFEKYNGEKARQIYQLLEKYSSIAPNLSAKKQQEILANLTVVVLSFFVYNGRDYCSEVEILYTDPFVQKLRDKNLENKTAATGVVYPELYARVKHKGQTLSIAELVRATGTSPLYIKAEGGGGKTTSVLAAVSEMHTEDEAALYIDAKQIDSYNGAEKDYYLLNCIGCFFEEYANCAETQTDRYNLVNNLLKRECRQLVVFIDGINETRDRTTLAAQIRALCKMDTVKMVITGRYFSGRITSAVAPLQYQLEMQEDMQSLVDRYCPEKAESYRLLDDATRRLLRVPMFFALYCAEQNTEKETNAAQLLKSSLMRTLEQQTVNYGNLARFVLLGVLPQFVAQLCSNRPSMSFDRRQFAEFVRMADADADIYQCVETIVTSGIVHTADSHNFYFGHENFRDFLWGYAASENVQTADTDCLLSMPSGSFALKCFAQLCGKKQLRRMLNSRSDENLTEEEWHSHRNAKLTAVLVECARILWDSRFGEGESSLFCGKNLLECDFRHCQIKDVAFDGSLTDKRSFGLEGHTTAVWALEKYKDRIYALDKNLLTCYTPQLEKLYSTAFNGGMTFVSCARTKNVLCAVDKKGRVRLFDLDTMEHRIVFEEGFVQVAAKNNGFVLADSKGQLLLCDTKLDIEKTVIYPQSENKPCIPMGCTAKAVIFGCGNILYRFDIARDSFVQLCKADAEITKGVCIGTSVVFAAGDGREKTKVMVWNGQTLREENTITAKGEAAAFLASIRLNAAKINDIAVSDDAVAMVANDGMLYLYTAEEEGDIVLEDVLCMQNISVQNPSIAVESCCFADSSTIVCGFTDRSIKLVDINPTNREKGRVKKQLKGSNNGIRRLFSTAEGIGAAIYDRGAALFEKSGDSLELKDKFVLSDSEWIWDGIQWGENLLFAAGSCVVVYSPQHSRVSSRKGFKSKVEALYQWNGDVYIAAGDSIYCAKNGNLENIQLTVTDRHHRRALCFAQREGRLYAGFSSIQEHSACLRIIDVSAKTGVHCDEKTWNFDDGWYRSLAFTPDGQYLLCGGLRQQTDSTVRDVTAVYKVGRNQLKSVGTLAGHSKAVLCVVTAGDMALTCSDDGCINVYSTVFGEENFVRGPQKTIKVSESQLFHMLLQADGSVLVCSLDGNIYNVNVKDGTVKTVYSNVAGMYCTNCDFSLAQTADGQKGAIF